MMVVPANTPVTTPELGSIVETDVLLLFHVPPMVPSLNVIVDPSHTVEGPVIAVGNGMTVTVTVT